MKESGRSLRAVALLAGVGTLAVCASASAAPIANFSNPQPISIPGSGNGSPYPSAIVVSGLAGLITDVNVTVSNASHTRPDDLAMVVVGPSGQALLLQSGAGDTPDLVDVTTTFDDSAPGQLPNLTAWPSGMYKPTGRYIADDFPAPGPGTAYNHPGPAAGGTATLSSTFTGTNPDGTWKLFVGDFQAGDSGSIAGGWSLQLQTSIADATAPETTIVAAPGATIASSTASLSFAANEFATFECSLDSAAFSACSSPKAYTALGEGPHTFAVRATDPTGNVEPIAASASFIVDTVAPATTIDLGPTGTISASTARFAFSANETVTFECKLDSAAFAACTSPQDYADLADGQHTFQLRATDAAGNVDRTGSSRTFAVGDATKPVAAIVKPRPKPGKRKAVVAFSATDDRTSMGALAFTCALDGGAASPCTSPTTFRGLAFGSHTVAVVATDLAGNASAPVTTRFKVKRKPN